MSADYDQRLEERVARAAQEALDSQRSVAPVDVLIALGWLHPSHLDVWRRRVTDLESLVQVDPERIARALELLRRWAEGRGLVRSEAEYLARSRSREPLRFSASGDEEIEGAFRVRWLSPELDDRERAKLSQRDNRPRDLVVIWPLKDFTCSICGRLGGGLLIMEESGAVCLACADMDHLVLLPSGDAALTRRARAAGRLWAVVVRFSRSRRRYERQGVLVEDALARAEDECLADAEARARRRDREARRRADQDLDLQARMASEISRLFPGCPPERADRIARHAAARGSGRVGRTAAGQALDPRALELAVAASIRHQDTRYDELLMSGVERDVARQQVRGHVADTMDGWRGTGEGDPAAAPGPRELR